MKTLPVILIVLLIGLSMFGVYQISTVYTDAQKAAWQVESSAKAVINVQLATVEAQEAAKRAQFWTAFYQTLLPVLLVIFAGSFAVWGWKVIDERTESKARMVDGSYALQRFTNAQGQQWTVDPNKQTFGAIGFSKSSGELITDAALVGPDRQLSYVQSIQRTRTAQATAISEIRNSAQAKYAAGFYDRPQQPRIVDDFADVDDAPPQLTVTPWQPLTLADAFAQSTADRWLLGQNATGACNFNVFDVCHTGLIGATKTGKTSSTALLMAMNARKHGMHVIALDGAGGVDWRLHKGILEVHESDYTTIGDQLNELVKIHDRRMQAIKLADVSNIDELDYTMPSLFVIMEEHGRTMQAYAAASPKQYKLTESALSNLMRVSRKTGIYFLLIDQSLNGWSGEVKANVKDYIAYHLGGNQGAAFNAYDLHKLRPNGQFWNNGNVYEAWHTKAQADALQRSLQPSRTKLLTNVQYSVIDDTNDTSINTRGEGKGENYPPKHDTSINTRNENTPVDDTSINTGSGINTSNDTSIKQPLLTGKPVSAKDRNTVRNVHAMTKSINETCRLVWGAKTPSRAQWVKEVLAGGEVQQ